MSRVDDNTTSQPPGSTESPSPGAQPTDMNGAQGGRSTVLLWIGMVLVVMGLFAFWMGIKFLTNNRGGSIAVADTSYRRPPENSSDPWLKEFTLTERSGKKVSSKDFAGQPYVTSFFFASCPGYCMQQNQKMAAAAAEYGPKGVKFVSISVDPENDTPAVLRDYAHRFKADENHWLFLTGDQQYIQRVGAEMFFVVAAKLTHSEKLVVSDKWGNIRGYFHWNDPAAMAEMRVLFDKLLAETEPPKELPNPAELAAPTVRVEPVEEEEE